MRNRAKILIAVVLMFTFWAMTAQAQKLGAEADAKPGQENVDEAFYKQLKLSTGKDDALIYQAMGLGYFEQGEFEKSYEFFKKAVRLNSRLYWSWYYLGLLKMADPQEFFKKAIKANTQFAPPYYWLGRYYCKAQKMKESIKYFQDYLKVAKGDINEADRIKIAEYFIVSMQHGETDYDVIAKMAR
jgi:tetratricopeptide (TPR) repeat protein